MARLSNVARQPARRGRRFDALAPARTVVELLEAEARRRGVTLALDGGVARPAIFGDPDAIQQILLNLIRNALDATPQGGHVHVALARATGPGGPALRIEVRDDGRGMDEATQAQAFQPFFTTRRDHGGTGLGLAVVKAITHELGATIALRSEPSAGTTIAIEVPAATVSAAEASHDDAA